MKKVLHIIVLALGLMSISISAGAFYDEFLEHESKIKEMEFNFMLGDGIYTDEQIQNYELYSYRTESKQEIKYLTHLLGSFNMDEIKKEDAFNPSLVVRYGFRVSCRYDFETEENIGLLHYSMSGSCGPYYQCVEWAFNKTYPYAYYSPERYYIIKDDSTEKLAETVRAIKSGELVIGDREITTETSSWAKTEVDAAIESDLVPKWNQIDYQYKINRYEVCQLAANYMEVNGFTRDRWPYCDVWDNETLLNISSIIGTLIEAPLLDINDDSVNCLYGCGIIEGKEDKKIYPYDYITREEFAKVLSKTYYFINSDAQTAYSESTYADSQKISDWAKEYVDEMTALGIMQGKDGGYFDPKGEITKEEVIVSLLRLNNITHIYQEN
ncbi:MAG: S-layer homology domain-containing protein [Candidatus Ornithomonoglobus sp.]